MVTLSQKVPVRPPGVRGHHRPGRWRPDQPACRLTSSMLHHLTCARLRRGWKGTSEGGPGHDGYSEGCSQAALACRVRSRRRCPFDKTAFFLLFICLLYVCMYPSIHLSSISACSICENVSAVRTTLKMAFITLKITDYRR